MNRLPAGLINVPVQVLCFSASSPLIRKGRMTCRDKDQCEIRLDRRETAFEKGMRVIVDGGKDPPFRLKGVITAVEGSRLVADIERIVEPDKRSFPRVCGGVHVRYRVVKADHDASRIDAWIRGDDTVSNEGEWWEPDPFMNFSGSGLKFEDTLHCEVGDVLLMRLRVGSSPLEWRVTGHVVRIEPLERDDIGPSDDDRQIRGPTHYIAVHYDYIPEEAREALAAFTLKIQNALLGI